MKHTIIMNGVHPPRQNQFRGRHWHVEHKLKTDFATELKIEACNQNIPKATKMRRVWLHLSGWERGSIKLPDKDAFDKAFLDCLVRTGLLIDDSPAWLQGRVAVSYERGPKRTIITLEDVVDDATGTQEVGTVCSAGA